MKNENKFTFKSGMTYYAHHKPSGEDWLLLGVNPKTNKVCVAGWPQTIADLSDCEFFVERGLIGEQELKHREKHFGTGWL